MFGDAYTAVRGRIAYLARSTDPTLPVSACPGWSIADVARHLTGLAVDVVNGNVEDYAGEEWTARQVTARADQPLLTVLDEWETVTPRLAELLDDIDASSLPEAIQTAAGPSARSTLPAAIVGDALHHEHDIRAAVRTPGDERDPMVILNGIGQVKMLRRAFTAKGLPTLRVRVEESPEPIDLGRDEPVATVAVTAFEAFRATGGRRTRDEIASYEWTGEPGQFIDHMVIPFMRMAENSIGERR